MSKISVKVKLKSNVEEIENVYSAIKLKDKIFYQEKDCKVTFLLNDLKLIREKEDYFIEMNFKIKEITECIINQFNKQFVLKIKTNLIVIKDKLILIEYQLLDTEEVIVFSLEELYV